MLIKILSTSSLIFPYLQDDPIISHLETTITIQCALYGLNSLIDSVLLDAGAWMYALTANPSAAGLGLAILCVIHPCPLVQHNINEGI